MNTLNLISFQRPTDAVRRDGWVGGWVGEVVRPEMGGEPICSCVKINFSLLFKDVRVALV